MNTLIIRNLLFTILQPGIVAGVVPVLLAKTQFQNVISSVLRLPQYLGILLFIPGVAILFHCIFRFIVEGKGTISPVDPTKRLVIKGLYKFSRNPMYVGVMMILVGETIFCNSSALLFYSISILTAFNLFIHYKEEPRLKKDFGEEYETYRRKVRRWL